MYKELCWQYRNIEMVSALKYGQRGIKLAQKLNYKKGEAEISRFLGLVYRHYFFFTESLQWYFKALDLSTQINDVLGIGFCYDNLGVTRYNQKQYDEALNYFVKAERNFQSIKHQEGLSYAYTHLSWVMTEKKQFQKALEYAQKALSIRRNNGANQEQISNALRDVAVTQIRLKEYNAAEVTLQEAIELARAVNRPTVIGDHLFTLADLYLRENKVADAITHLQISYNLAQKGNNRLQKMKCANVLADVYGKAQKYQEALKYQTEYFLLKDSLFNEDINNKTASLEAKFQFDLKERELLEAQKRQELENKRKLDRERFLSSLLIAALLFMGVLAFFIYQKRKQDKFVNEELVQKNAEISRQNQEIQEQTTLLAENNHFKDRLFSIISHDLRSPVVGLVGSLELMNEGLLSETEFRQMLPDLAHNINSIQSLLDNLLAWARTQMKGIAILPEAFHIRELLDEKISMFKKQIEAKDLKIFNNIESDLQVLADKNMIDLVARNLLSNAIKFSVQGGTITMTSSRQKGYSQICIADNGIGISAENINKLFDTQTVSTKGTAGEIGTGLGLLLSKEFIEQNGGKIWGESVVDEGSTFCFTIPE